MHGTRVVVFPLVAGLVGVALSGLLAGQAVTSTPPAAPVRPVTERLHGVAVTDPNAAVVTSQPRSLPTAQRIDVVDELAREPMIVEHPDGALFVSGYSDSNPKLWQSTDRGRTWARVNVGTEADGAIGNSDVDLAVAPDGTLYFAQMGFDRKTAQGTHIAMGVSRDAGATWKWTMLSRKRFVDRPWVAVAPDGTAHAIWNDWDGVWHVTSRDRGATWTGEQQVNDKGGSSHLAVGPRGELAVRITPMAASGRKLDDGTDLVAVSIDGGRTWQKRAAPGDRDWPSKGSRTLTTRRWVEPLAWDAAGALYYFWTSRDGLWLARSADLGSTWTKWNVQNAAGAAYYPYLVAGNKGQLAATWFSGQDQTWTGHVMTMTVAGTAFPVVAETAIQPETWGLSSRRENPKQRNSAGEYLAAAFLRDGRLAVVSPIQNEGAARFGFSFWTIDRER